jgi:hypothetical protein
VASHARPLLPNRSAAGQRPMRLRCRIDWTWFLQPGALAHDVGAAGDLATQRVGLVIRQPDRGQVVGRQQPRQHCRVDLVGLDLGLGDRPRLLRVGDHHPTRVALQQPRDRIGVAGRLQGHLVADTEAGGEGPQRLWGGLDPAGLPDHAVLPDGDLGELAVDVQPDASAHPVLPSLSLPREHRRANDTYGSALAAQPGESQGRPCTNSGSQPIERSPACPTCVAPGCPCPGRSHRTPQLTGDHQQPIRGRRRHPRPFIPVTNTDDAAHDFAVEAADLDTGTIQAGAVATATFTVPEGTTEFVCIFHRGMTGTIQGV